MPCGRDPRPDRLSSTFGHNMKKVIAYHELIEPLSVGADLIPQMSLLIDFVFELAGTWPAACRHDGTASRTTRLRTMIVEGEIGSSATMFEHGRGRRAVVEVPRLARDARTQRRQRASAQRGKAVAVCFSAVACLDLVPHGQLRTRGPTRAIGGQDNTNKLRPLYTVSTMVLQVPLIRLQCGIVNDSILLVYLR